MKYEVYCHLDIEEYIDVDAEDEDEAMIEAKTIFLRTLLYVICIGKKWNVKLCLMRNKK